MTQRALSIDKCSGDRVQSGVEVLGAQGGQRVVEDQTKAESLTLPVHSQVKTRRIDLTHMTLFLVKESTRRCRVGCHYQN
jgi:hypothetical protein